MSKLRKYPDEYELTEACVNFIKRRTLNDFMQGNGIFVINGSSEDCAKLLSHSVWQKNSIEEIRDNAYRQNIKTTLSGFVIKSSASDFSLQELYEDVRDNDKITLKKGYKLGSLTRVESSSGAIIYKGRLDYSIKRPGRISLLDCEESSCEFFITENEDYYQVEVDGTRASDGKEVQSLFSQITDHSTTEIKSLNIDLLTDRQTIEFFDMLISNGMSSDWRLTDVAALTFKQGRNQEDDEEDSDDNNEGSDDSNVLTGIKQAILEGKNLREDAFVKKFENDGCIFTAMTLEFQHKSEPLIVQIRAEFKGNPKIFEVSVVDSFKIEGTNATRIQEPLTQERNLNLRSLFWNNAHAIFQNIINGTTNDKK